MARIVDSHCHAFEVWPDGPVPDPTSRGAFEQLLFEMDDAGVDAGLLVAGSGVNPTNNDYVARAAAEHPGRVIHLPDVDSRWSDTYHRPGAARRLGAAVRRYGSVGFNHYLHDDDPGDWLTSKAGMEFFGAADEMGLVVSIHARPHQLGHLKRLAATFPGTVFLLHHLGFPMRGAGIDPVAMSEIEACSELSNIHIKVSGFDIGLKRFWDYPYPTTQRAFMRLFRAFGATRCHWGSNYPMCRPSMTYRQALECVQESRFLTAREVELVLGESLIQILGEGIVPSRPSIRSTPAT